MIVCLKPRVKAVTVARAAEPPKTADPFYLTKEWRQARDIAVGLARGRCRHCNRKPRMVFVDHIVELKDGGAPYDQSNLEALCGSCHTKKTLRTRDERQVTR